jgi:hypothetical protein
MLTLNTVGNLYKDQGKMAEAEEMYVRVLRGYEKAASGNASNRSQFK